LAMRPQSFLSAHVAQTLPSSKVMRSITLLFPIWNRPNQIILPLFTQISDIFIAPSNPIRVFRYRTNVDTLYLHVLPRRDT
jgi:hypothetical protein